jgi:hypothetical protein
MTQPLVYHYLGYYIGLAYENNVGPEHRVFAICGKTSEGDVERLDLVAFPASTSIGSNLSEIREYIQTCIKSRETTNDL